MSEESTSSDDDTAKVGMGAVIVDPSTPAGAVVKINRPLPAFFPSHDKRLMLNTVETISIAATILQRPLMPRPNGGIGQAVAINGMIAGWKADCDRQPTTGNKTLSDVLIEQRTWVNPKTGETKTRPVARVLWVEDDIMLNPGQANEIANLIQMADEHGWNIVAPYCTGFRNSGEFNWVYYKMPDEQTGEIGRPFTEDEIRNLKPFERINGLAGLGFYYGDLFIDYAFYEGTYNGHDRFGLPSYSGIDWNYFLDNFIDLRHYPLMIVHEKPLEMMNLRVLKHYGDGTIHEEHDPANTLVGVTTTHEAMVAAEERRKKYVVS